MATRQGYPPARWWGKDAGAGLIGGICMGAYMMMVMAIAGLGFWRPLNMIAALLPSFRPPVSGFGWSSFVGAMIHMIDSAVLGLVYGALALWIVPRAFRSWGWSSLAGLVYGLATYVVVGRWIGPAFDPPMGMVPQGHFFVAHLIYGLVTAWLATAWTSRSDVSISLVREVSVEDRTTLHR